MTFANRAIHSGFETHKADKKMSAFGASAIFSKSPLLYYHLNLHKQDDHSIYQMEGRESDSRFSMLLKPIRYAAHFRPNL